MTDDGWALVLIPRRRAGLIDLWPMTYDLRFSIEEEQKNVVSRSCWKFVRFQAWSICTCTYLFNIFRNGGEVENSNLAVFDGIFWLAGDERFVCLESESVRVHAAAAQSQSPRAVSVSVLILIFQVLFNFSPALVPRRTLGCQWAVSGDPWPW